MPRLTALNADPARLDPHEQNFVGNIRKHGWTGTHVAAENTAPGFSYTTGFWLKFKFPELIVFGLKGKAAHDTFWHMYRTLAAGKRFAIGTHEDDIFENVSAMLLSVSRLHYRDRLGWNRWFYGNDEFDCLQLIFPDVDGHFPWEGSVRAAPPDLTEGNWSGLRHH
jgi:hypothetical protein